MADDREERRPRRNAPEAEAAPTKGKKAKKEKPKKVKKEKKPKKVKAKKVKKVKKAKKVKKGKEGKGEGEGGKKGKKLPVFIALAVVLLGGGFFGLKMASAGPEEVPPITLGDDTHVINLGEFLVNTKDGTSFLKANVLIHLADGTHLFGEGGHGEALAIETMAPYIDAVRKVLSKQSLVTLASDEGEREAKIAIAEAINKVYHSMHHEEKEEGEEGDHGDAPAEEESHEGEEEEEPENPDWHSQEGPVLIVYLTDYAWS